jgi:hypothetical protein
MTPALAVAAQQGVNSKTLQKYYDRMRRSLAQLNERSAAESFGGTNADPEQFREAARKKGMGEAVPLFCLACRDGKVSLLIAEESGEPFAEVACEAVVGWIYAHDQKAYAALDLDRIHFLAASPDMRNGIEASFWSSAKKGLVKYHGGFRKNFRLFMREMEFRFNARQEQDLQGFLLEMLMTTIETGEEHVQM